MKYILAFSIYFYTILIPPQLFAIVNPLDAPNNKYGIHIIDESDLPDAAKLVNGNGGEWGYVTIVIQENDRDVEKWQNTFDRMRKLKVIPVVRLATYAEGSNWHAPSEDDAAQWARFLDSLNWVVQNRYVVLFNEPNHAKEWGGTIDPAQYTRIASSFQNALKSQSDDFFILPAGLDLAAGNTKGTMNASTYFQQMVEAKSDIFTLFDGWTSHSYPNPAFSGSVYATGKSSIRGYEWEISYLSQYGLDKNISVFITETGWIHEDGQQTNQRYYSTREVADLYETAFLDVWTDPSIVMVSPFVLNYQAGPFDHFSWKKLNGHEYYEQYHRVLGIAKQQGEPSQIDSAAISTANIPSKLTTNSLYFLPILIKNTGQVIWDNGSNLKLHAVAASGESELVTRAIPALNPNQETVVTIPLKTSYQELNLPLVLAVENKDGVLVSDTVSKQLTVRKPSSLWGRLMQFLSERFGY